MHDPYLASEREIVWTDDPARFRFVRERIHRQQPAQGRPPDIGSTRIVAFAELDPDKRDPERRRRVWLSRPGDDCYPIGRHPFEAADPASIAAGVRVVRPHSSFTQESTCPDSATYTFATSATDPSNWHTPGPATAVASHALRTLGLRPILQLRRSLGQTASHRKRMERKYPPSLYLKRLMKTLPPPATAERRRELCKLLPASRDELINETIGLAVHLAERHVTPAVEHLREDLQGAAFQGLCEAVDRLTPESTGPTAYITSWIEGRVREAVEAELPTSDDEARKRKRKKRDPVDAMPDDGAGIVGGVVDPMAAVDLRDAIEAACSDDIDKALVAAFERGDSVADVADALGITEGETRRRREAIYERYRRT